MNARLKMMNEIHEGFVKTIFLSGIHTKHREKSIIIEVLVTKTDTGMYLLDIFISYVFILPKWYDICKRNDREK